MRAALLAASTVFLAAHLVSLPSSFEDLDSLNFALGVRQFDVASHQPHPPGYPVYVAIGKLSTATAAALGVASPEVRGLAIWSALAGALLIPLIYWLWAGLDGAGRTAMTATALTVATPLYWFTALRPLSDMVGLAGAVAALAALIRAWPGRSVDDRRGRWLLLGAVTAGFAVGIRSQTAVLTGPLLAATVLLPWSRLPVGLRGLAVIAFAGGVATWGIPLVVASGGPTAYLLALSSQAGEDFAGVVMLWTQPTPRVAAAALLDTFVRPWDAPMLAGVVLALAGAGGLVLVRRAPWSALFVAVMFLPYLVFHLLFQESVTVRYALPVVLPVAFCAAVLIAEARVLPAALTAALIGAAGLWLAVPAGIAFGRTASPVFAALDAMERDRPRPVLGMHRRVFTESRRARQWQPPPAGQTLAAPRDLEWLELSRALRTSPDPVAWFLADPRRTDLALIDPRGRVVTPFRWPFNGRTYTGGSRPDEIDLHTVDRPGWILERGWALTPETAGVAAREGWGLDQQPGTGWVRRRPGPATLVIGGRHLGTTTRAAGQLAIDIDGREVLTREVTPGPFLYWIDLPAGALAGPDGYAPLQVELSPLSEDDRPPVALEQFDLQEAGAVLWAYDTGWQEPEYDPGTGRSWRWMSARASLVVRPAGHDIVLTLNGENPRRYFDRTPEIRVLAGETVVGRLSPGRDFAVSLPIAATVLAEAGGRLVIESSEAFVPADRDGSADRRQLAVRLFHVSVEAAR